MTLTEELLPKNWDCMNKGCDLKLVKLEADSQEYKMVAKHFHDQGAKEDIKMVMS
jgi:hypothetical protein